MSDRFGTIVIGIDCDIKGCTKRARGRSLATSLKPADWQLGKLRGPANIPLVFLLLMVLNTLLIFSDFIMATDASALEESVLEPEAYGKGAMAVYGLSWLEDMRM